MLSILRKYPRSNVSTQTRNFVGVIDSSTFDEKDRSRAFQAQADYVVDNALRAGCDEYPRYRKEHMKVILENIIHYVFIFTYLGSISQQTYPKPHGWECGM